MYHLDSPMIKGLVQCGELDDQTQFYVQCLKQPSPFLSVYMNWTN